MILPHTANTSEKRLMLLSSYVSLRKIGDKWIINCCTPSNETEQIYKPADGRTLNLMHRVGQLFMFASNTAHYFFVSQQFVSRVPIMQCLNVTFSQFLFHHHVTA